jgi:C_GCAxxG_C_C family probable redox protein
MSRVDEVISGFRGGLNCAQAVFSVYGPLYGMERQQCICVAAPFGAGIARTQDICGAVTGSLMVLGLRYCHIGLEVKPMKDRPPADAREFMRQFAGTTAPYAAASFSAVISPPKRDAGREGRR